MKEDRWNYMEIEKTDILSKIRFIEKLLQKHGAEYAGGNTRSSYGSSVFEEIHQNLWKIKENYIGVDMICFPEKPFLVLEFSENYDGPYEDADPFPYDLNDADLEAEVKRAVDSLN